MSHYNAHDYREQGCGQCREDKLFVACCNVRTVYVYICDKYKHANYNKHYLSKENIQLAQSIVKNGGLIISEYPLGSPPLKQHFPARNRIISGVSDGVLVTEARKNSGTNITVDFALEQGKDVFVIPGNIYSKTSDGTNFMISEGAIPVTSYKDILKME